jgi:hypothetical protein
MRNTNKAWQNFGQIDPYFTVLAHPRFREAAKEGKARREFFTSGEEHVERFLAAVREDLDPKFTHGRNFLHSFIAFQHIPARRSANILREMPRRLSENGVGALHFNIRNLRPRLETLVARTPRDLPLGQRPTNLVKGDSFRRPYIEMHSYNVNRSLLHLRERGCRQVHFRFSDYGLYKGKVLLFKKETLPLS